MVRNEFEVTVNKEIYLFVRKNLWLFVTNAKEVDGNWVITFKDDLEEQTKTFIMTKILFELTKVKGNKDERRGNQSL